MARGCGLRAESAWGARGLKAKGEGLCAGGSVRRICVGPEGSEGIMLGRPGRRGARGGGPCMDLAVGGLKWRVSLPQLPSGVGG